MIAISEWRLMLQWTTYRNREQIRIQLFKTSNQHKNANVANLILDVPWEMKQTNGIWNIEI